MKMQKEKDANQMTRKDFENLPNRGSFNTDIGLIDSVVFLPTRKKHDSGFRCIDFVAVKGNTPFCRLSGCSDVIHLEGIGGYGFNWLSKYHTCPATVPPSGWSIDCLPTSGLFRLFCGRKISVSEALSSFEIYTREKN